MKPRDRDVKAFGLPKRFRVLFVAVISEKPLKITNREYKELTGSISQTALRDLRDLTAFGLVEKVGATGRGTYYRLRKKPGHKPNKPTTDGQQRG